MLFWTVIAALLNPALDPSQLLFGGLAVVLAAVLIVAAAAGLPVLTAFRPVAWRVVAQRAAARRTSRVADPDAAGRPRPRAPSADPTAA